MNKNVNILNKDINWINTNRTNLLLIESDTKCGHNLKIIVLGNSVLGEQNDYINPIMSNMLRPNISGIMLHNTS